MAGRYRLHAVLMDQTMYLHFFSLVSEGSSLNELSERYQYLRNRQNTFTNVYGVIRRLLLSHQVVMLRSLVVLHLVIYGNGFRLILGRLLQLLKRGLEEGVTKRHVPVTFFFRFISEQRVLLAVHASMHTLAVYFSDYAGQIVKIDFYLLRGLRFKDSQELVNVRRSIRAVQGII